MSVRVPVGSRSPYDSFATPSSVVATLQKPTSPLSLNEVQLTPHPKESEEDSTTSTHSLSSLGGGLGPLHKQYSTADLVDIISQRDTTRDRLAQLRETKELSQRQSIVPEALALVDPKKTLKRLDDDTLQRSTSIWDCGRPKITLENLQSRLLLRKNFIQEIAETLGQFMKKNPNPTAADISPYKDMLTRASHYLNGIRIDAILKLDELFNETICCGQISKEWAASEVVTYVQYVSGLTTLIAALATAILASPIAALITIGTTAVASASTVAKDDAVEYKETIRKVSEVLEGAQASHSQVKVAKQVLKMLMTSREQNMQYAAAEFEHRIGFIPKESKLREVLTCEQATHLYHSASTSTSATSPTHRTTPIGQSPPERPPTVLQANQNQQISQLQQQVEELSQLIAEMSRSYAATKPERSHISRYHASKDDDLGSEVREGDPGEEEIETDTGHTRPTDTEPTHHSRSKEEKADPRDVTYDFVDGTEELPEEPNGRPNVPHRQCDMLPFGLHPSRH